LNEIPADDLQITTNSFGPQILPAVSGFGSHIDNFIVVYQDNSSYPSRIKAKLFDGSGNLPIAETTIADPTSEIIAQNHSKPDISCFDNQGTYGCVVVMFAGAEIWSHRINVIFSPNPVIEIITPAKQVSRLPNPNMDDPVKVDCSQDGTRFAVAWVRFRNSETVYYRVFDFASGNPVFSAAGPERAVQSAPRGQRTPEVAYLSDEKVCSMVSKRK